MENNAPLKPDSAAEQHNPEQVSEIQQEENQATLSPEDNVKPEVSEISDTARQEGKTVSDTETADLDITAAEAGPSAGMPDEGVNPLENLSEEVKPAEAAEPVDDAEQPTVSEPVDKMEAKADPPAEVKDMEPVEADIPTKEDTTTSEPEPAGDAPAEDIMKAEPEAGKTSGPELETEVGAEAGITEAEAQDTEAVQTRAEDTGATPEAKKEEEQPAPENKAEDGDESEDEDEDEDDDEDADDGHDDPQDTEEKFQALSRKELVEAFEEALKEDELSRIKRRISLIRVVFMNKTREEKSARFDKFVAEGGETETYDESPDELEQRFQEAFGQYKARKAAWEQQQELVRQQNLEAKNKILEELKELISSEESLKKTYDEFRALQEQWTNIGMVPRADTNNLWQNYHFLVEKFFDKVKINKELRDLDLKKNLESKIELCEKADELLIETSIDKSFRLLQQYHREWKEIGPVPMDKKDEIWERFKHTTDLINQRRREHYELRQEEMDKNLLAKKALCEQAEAVSTHENKSVKAWQEETDKMTELFNIWKTIGPAPRTDNDKIWQRFRGAMESFYNAKKEFFGKMKDEQLNNYNLKLDLCVRAEALQSSTDWRETTRELIDLQKKWKEIGAVPRKHSEKIWKRFRAACDAFFNAKDDYFKNIHAHEGENLEKKEALIKKIQDHSFGDDKSTNLETLKTFQREWMEIGHVPFKEKDRLQKAFRTAIDKKLKELNISSMEMSKVNYREKIENLKDNQNSGRLLSKERGHLNGKIKEMKEEINLWENNLGFLANSKKADILKEEFSRKIEKAKQELALLEAKLRMLKD